MTMKNMKRENLLEKLRKEGRFVENPCNGKGICGKCKVKILSGDAGKVTETERRFLSEEELARVDWLLLRLPTKNFSETLFFHSPFF